jgi:heme-degrading monooxygenase HmoA
MTLRNLLVTAMVVGTGLSTMGTPHAQAEDMVYELRTYSAVPGKLPDLEKRFRDHTMQIFEKHGIKNIGYWIPTDKPDTLIYIIAHKSRSAAAASWKAFHADPEWKQVQRESEKNGKLVTHVDSVYMTPTDYSPMK